MRLEDHCMSATHNNIDQELPRTWCHKGHNLSSPAIHPDAADPGWRARCIGELGNGTSAVGTL